MKYQRNSFRKNKYFMEKKNIYIYIYARVCAYAYICTYT